MKTRALNQIIMVVFALIIFLIPNEADALTRGGVIKIDGTKIVTYSGSKLDVLNAIERTKAKYRDSQKVKSIWLKFSDDGHAKCSISINRREVAKLIEAVEIETTPRNFNSKEFGLRKKGWKIRKTYFRNHGTCEPTRLFVNMRRETFY